MGYNFTAIWLKGSNNNAPDGLSRHPVSEPSPCDMLAEVDTFNQPEPSISEIRAFTTSTQTNPHLETLLKAAKEDPEYQQLRQFILDGFPSHRSQLPDSCKRYWSVRDHLTIDDNLIVYGCRLLIPTKLRSEILTQLHESHQGSIRTKQRARLSVYWPGIDNDIDNVILSCKQCQDHLPSNPKEPIIQKPQPARRFQEIAVDLYSHAGHTYLVIVDCLTDRPAVISLDHGTASQQVIVAIHQSFCRTAIPDVVWSDGGPQFISKQFNDFASRWGFRHVVSSPRYPQSNGKVEATVKSMKKLLRTCWTGRQWIMKNSAELCCSTKTLPAEKMGYLLHKNYLGIQCKTFYQLTIMPSHQSGNVLLQWQNNSIKIIWHHLLNSTINRPTHCLTSSLDHMLLSKIPKVKLWTSMVSSLRSTHNVATTLRLKGLKGAEC